MKQLRRFKQQLSDEQCENILKQQHTGILSVYGKEGYPYSIPLNYVYIDHKIYFHSANTGHKIESIKANNNVCFCVIENDKVVPEIFATYYSSVVVFGKAKFIEEEDKKYHVLTQLNEKYSPNHKETGEKEIIDGIKHVAIVEISIEEMTGKTSSDSVNTYYMEGLK